MPFSVAFWIVYLLGGFSDCLDGFIARKLKQQNAFGAKLDSFADIVFAATIAIIAIKNISFPVWVWFCAALIAFLRIVAYGIGFYKFRTFSSLHTYMNKATGVLVFAFPLLYALLGLSFTGVVLCIVAFLSALEETLITIKSKELNRDCLGIFSQ